MALKAIAEGLLLLALAAAPWCFGGTPDWARYSLAAALLFGAAAAAVGTPSLPRPLLPALGLLLLGPLQIALGTSLGPVQTLEASLVFSAIISAFLFWTCRGQSLLATRRLVAVVLLTSVGQAALALSQVAEGRPQTIYGLPVPGGSPVGSFVNHNHFAGLMGMAAPLAFGTAIGLARARKLPGSLCVAGVGILLLLTHLASHSRGGALALFAGLGSLAVLAALRARGPGHRRRRAIALAGSAAVLLASALALLPADTSRHLLTIARGAEDASGSYRLDVALATLRLTASEPLLGAGLGAFGDAITPYKLSHGELRTTHAESDLLEFAAEAGLVGWALIAWFGWAVVRRILAGIKVRRDPIGDWMALGAAAGVAALCAHSLIDFNLRIPSNALVFGSLLGIAAARPSSGTRSLGRRECWGAVILLVALGAAATWRASGAFELRRALHLPAAALRAAALGRLVARHPYLAEAHMERARLSSRSAALPHARPRLSRALASAEAALEVRPAWGAACAEVGRIRWLLGDQPGAARALRLAAGLDPTNVHIGATRAAFLVDSRDWSAGVAELERVVRMNPGWRGRARSLALAWTTDPELRRQLASRF